MVPVCTVCTVPLYVLYVPRGSLVHDRASEHIEKFREKYETKLAKWVESVESYWKLNDVIDYDISKRVDFLLALI